MGFAALQETMWSQDITVRGRNGEAIINFLSPEAGYIGLGLYLSSKWTQRLVTTRIINGRMVVIRFKAFTEGKTDLVVVNVYAPTTMRAKEQPEITESLYHELSQLYKEEEKGATSVFLLGDFNSKWGNHKPMIVSS